MAPSRYRRLFLPVILATLGLLLLARLFFGAGAIFIPEDLDVIILVTLIGVTMVVSIRHMLRIWLQYLRQLNVRQVRRETLAEHRRFLSRLDHELKNPLTTLRAGLGALSLTQMDERQHQLVETMKAETLRMSRLVTDLRKLTDLETQPLNLQSVDIQAFFDRLLQLERERFRSVSRALTHNVHAEASEWLFDEDLLALAMHNVFDNAFKFTSPGDSVHLTVASDQELVIELRDTGIGVPASDLAHIWEELYRAQEAMPILGSGIGLALVRAIVERHEGEVSATSKPGQGTTIEIRIPPGLA